ncbi:MAG TPA: hydroxyacid dehydrogenase [Bacteroidetes bacterium]|nr:hydroxyacid dehydrogenase [Bacteroidota bacterium]
MCDKPKCVFITYRIPEESVEPLLQAGCKVVWPKGRKATYEELEQNLPCCDAVLSVFGNPFPDELIEKASRLKILSNYGAGVDNINLALATEKGIVVTNTPDQVTEPTAELAMTLMLSLARRVTEMDRKLRQDKRQVRWGVMENLGFTLENKTIGIIGMGRIGKATARRARAFRMKIVYYNRHRLPKDEEKKLEIRYVPLDTLLRIADVVSLHTPLTKETRHLIGEKELELMKPSAILVNTARGPVVNEQALIRALQEKKIAGAALDVFEKEPEIPDAFLQMDHVVAVPHIGTAAWETRVEIGRQAARNILDFFSGKTLKYCVNKEVLDSNPG